VQQAPTNPAPRPVRYPGGPTRPVGTPWDGCGPAAQGRPAQALRAPGRQAQAQGKGRAEHPGTRAAAPGMTWAGARGGAADMAELCRAAHGVTSPAVTALCHQTYVTD
jgi:hypothetical protein